MNDKEFGFEELVCATSACDKCLLYAGNKSKASERKKNDDKIHLVRKITESQNNNTQFIWDILCVEVGDVVAMDEGLVILNVKYYQRCQL